MNLKKKETQRLEPIREGALFKTKQGPEARRQRLWGTGHCTFGAREQSCGGWLCRRASGSPHGPLSQIREMCSRGPTQDFQIRPGAMGRCPPIFGWGLGPAHGSPVKENPSGELEVRTGGQHGGWGLHLTGPPPPPPRWHHKARSRISPVPALTSRQRRRILSHAIWRARRSPEHCGGRGEGAGAHPRARKKRQVPLPHVLSDWRWTGGWEGAAGSAGLGTEGRVTAGAVPACPLPCLLPHSTLSARSTGPPRIPAFLPFTSNQSRQPLLALLRPSLFTCWTTRLGGPGDAAKWLGHGHLGSHSLAPHRWPFGGKSSALPQHTCPHQSYLEHGDVGGKCLARCPSGCLNGMEVYRFMCGFFFFFFGVAGGVMRAAL